MNTYSSVKKMKSGMPDDTLTSVVQKTAEPIEMPFGLWTPVDPRKHVLDGVQIPRAKGQLLGKMTCPGWSDRRHTAVSCTIMAEPIDLPFGL